MSLIAAFIGAMPEKCADCRFVMKRKDDTAWPHICDLDESEIYDIEGSIPGDCPLLLLKEEL